MHIITLMDYHTEPYITMCKAWLYLASKNNPEAKITIYGFNFHPEILSYIKNFPKTKIVFMKKQNVFMGLTGFTHPSQNLQLSLWNYIPTPCIYVDPDALILDSLQDWWSIILEKDFIAVSERKYDNQTFFNYGVFSYSRNNFITLTKMKRAVINNYISIPAGAQGILNMYFRLIKYDWSHPKIDYSYNCFTKNCQVKQINDKAIKVFPGRYSIFTKMFNRMMNGYNDWWEDWLWWNKKKRVKIVHAFGDDFKFWKLPECKSLWSYLQSKFN
jgi:hypothetical protein